MTLPDTRIEDLSEKGRKQRLSPAERAAANPKSLRLAICAMCFNCQGGDMQAPHVTKSFVRDCKTKSCPLWSVRGWQNTTTRKYEAPTLKTPAK